jgi:hypothetical protein
VTAVALLAALAVGINAGPAYFGDTGCERITPVLAHVPGPVVAGQFRDTLGGCYVWLNLWSYPPRQLCQIALHEYGHLAGFTHSPNPRSVMYSPLQPHTPKPCR